MLRILHSVSNMDRGGIETMLMNYYRNIDRDKIQFDFICNKLKPGDFDEEIKELGGRIFHSPGLGPWKYPEYMRFMKGILAENPDIKIVHAHNEGMAFYPLSGAKRAGLDVRIAHAHNTRTAKDYKWALKVLCKKMLPCTANYLWGCGNAAGIYYFGKEKWERCGRLINNAIPLDSFKFNQNVRDEIRKEYGLSDSLVIGHVGRFSAQKNHLRLIDIFSAVVKKRPDAKLILIGEGELTDSVNTKVGHMGLNENVINLGLLSDVGKMYQAMDVFAMPSLFEGLPVVGIEAQASGLPCIYSDKVSDEAVILPYSKRVSLSAEDDVWADALINNAAGADCRKEGYRFVAGAGYDVKEEAKKLEKLYESMVPFVAEEFKV